jgi:hypothetical protein
VYCSQTRWKRTAHAARTWREQRGAEGTEGILQSVRFSFFHSQVECLSS